MTHSQRYEEIDVSEWTVADEEALGTKPKAWLRDPKTNQLWLMKYRTYNRHEDDTIFPKGDDWSERVANGVAECLGCLRLERSSRSGSKQEETRGASA